MGLTHPHRSAAGTFAPGPSFGTRVYHGSPRRDLTEIRCDPPARQYDNATSQLGAFFALTPADAQRYAGGEGVVYVAPLPVTKPARMTAATFNRFQNPARYDDGMPVPAPMWSTRAAHLVKEARAYRERMHAAGYDGVVIEGPDGTPVEIAAFRDVPVEPWAPGAASENGGADYVMKADVAPTGPNGGLYVGRPLVNVAQLKAWAEKHNIPLVPDPHVTVVFSRQDVSLALTEPLVIVGRSAFKSIAPLGTKGAIVLHFDSVPLTLRWHEAMAAGASWDYPSGYLAHLTLTYDGANVVWANVPLPDFPLVFGPEAAGPLSRNPFAGLFPEVPHPGLVRKGDGHDCTRDDCDDPDCAKHGKGAKRLTSHPGENGAGGDHVGVGLGVVVSKAVSELTESERRLRADLEARTPHTIDAIRRGMGPDCIEKAGEEEQRIAAGFFQVAVSADGKHVVDRQRDVITIPTLARAAAHFMRGPRTLGALHIKKDDGTTDPFAPELPFGEVIEMLIVTPTVKRVLGLPASTPLGAAGAGKIHSDVVWKMVKERKLSAFSVFGPGHRIPVRVDDPAGPVGRTDR